MTLRGKWTWVLWLSPILYWFAPTHYLHARRTLDPFTFNDDARILIWPFFSDADPTLFHGDPFASYFKAGLPEGYRALYHCFGWLGVAAQASEVLPYVLLLFTVGFIFASALRLGGKPGAFLATVLLLGSASVFDRMGGGLPRAFAFPIVAVGCYALIAGNARLLAAMAVLGAAFYPVVAALLGLALFFLLVLPSRLRGEKSVLLLREKVVLLGVTLVTIIALLTPTAVRLRPYGVTITQPMLAQYPEAGPFGRLGPEQQAPFPPWYESAAVHAKQGLRGKGEPLLGYHLGALRDREPGANFLVYGALSAAAIALSVRALRRRQLPSAALRLSALLLALIVGYTLASWVTPKLFLPERYAQFTVPLLSVLLLAAGLGASAADEPSQDSPNGRLQKTRFDSRWFKSKGTLAWAVVLVGVALLGGRGISWVGIEVWIPPEERPLYAELEHLPVDAVVAGWPLGPLENIPYLSKRRVLTNFQLEMPFHQGFTDATRRRVQALFEAYFAHEDAPIARLQREFGVTHLLVDPRYFEAPMPTYYRPFDVDVWRGYRASSGRSRLLELAHDSQVSRAIGRLYLVNLSAFAKQQADKPTIFR